MDRQADPPSWLRCDVEQLGGPDRARGLPRRQEVESSADRGPARRHRSQGARQDARPGDHRRRAGRSIVDRLHVPARDRQGEIRREGAAARAHRRRAIHHAERADLFRRQLSDAGRRGPVPQPQAGRGHSDARQGVRALRALARGSADRRRQPHLHSARRRAGAGRAEEARLMKNLIAAVLFACAMPSVAQDYVAARKLSGTIRVSGNDEMAALMKRWESGFRKFHPGVRFEQWLKGADSGMYGLEMRTADMALMGRPINPYERYGVYERAWVYPVEIEVATGSFNRPHKSPAYTIFVHKDNPLAKLTVKQLDRIFGAERAGGWNALTWDLSAARSKADNIRTWGQLGLTGEWASKPIHVYGPPNLGAGTTTYFQSRVMGGGEIFNEDLREYADRPRMIADLAGDRYGIAYTAQGYGTPGVKVVAIGEKDAGPFVAPTRASVSNRRYPLSRPVYIYYAIDNEKTEIAKPRVDPKVREFLRYVLSPQGQQAVAAEGVYLPLTRSVIDEQLKKLDFDGVPPERQLLEDD